MSAGVEVIFAGATALAPLASGGAGQQESIAHERNINRAEVENLQRWVSSGHADWCKDARLVAAEELWRLAPEYSGDGSELNSVYAGTEIEGGSRVTFEWSSPDRRTRYRVTVERFAWLLSIAKDTESMAWVPTTMRISVQKPFALSASAVRIIVHVDRSHLGEGRGAWQVQG